MTPAVVLAAGTSSRYAGGNKLLAEFDGQPLIVRVVARLQPAAHPIVIVTGHQASRVRRCLQQGFGNSGTFRFVHNRDYRAGMAGSLRLGVRALPSAATKAFVCLGDMPGVDARLLRRLCSAWAADVDVVRPVCRRRPGHPVLVSARLSAGFDTLSGDQGAKSILADIPEQRQRHVPWHAGCILDADTPASLRRAELQCRRIASSLT